MNRCHKITFWTNWLLLAFTIISQWDYQDTEHHKQISPPCWSITSICGTSLRSAVLQNFCRYIRRIMTQSRYANIFHIHQHRVNSEESFVQHFNLPVDCVYLSEIVCLSLWDWLREFELGLQFSDLRSQAGIPLTQTAKVFLRWKYLWEDHHHHHTVNWLWITSLKLYLWGVDCVHVQLQALTFLPDEL